jgi:hypothetical protein
MKSLSRILPLTLLMIVSIGVLHAQEVVKSPKGKFTARLPNGFPSANESSTNVPTAVGTLKMTTFMSTNEEAVCIIAYADYPAKAFKETDLEVMLDNTRDGAMEKINGEILREESITLNGYPGRSVYCSSSSGGSMIYGRFDYYIVKSRLYQVVYMTSNEEEVSHPNTEAFFDSFALINKKSRGK